MLRSHQREGTEIRFGARNGQEAQTPGVGILERSVCVERDTNRASRVCRSARNCLEFGIFAHGGREPRGSGREKAHGGAAPKLKSVTGTTAYP
jgi:hypothetical protein